MRLLVATHNRGKLREYEALLAGLGLEVVDVIQAGIASALVEEIGATLEENAVLKARAYAEASGLLTLADDSGLEVDVLGGQPGVRSARYDDHAGSDEDRCQVLLRLLAGVPEQERGARFRCVIAVASPKGEVRIAMGTCEGRIACQRRGSYGFGYDPIFFVPEYGRTMAELPPEVKNRISHRARAAQGAREILRCLLGE